MYRLESQIARVDCCWGTDFSILLTFRVPGMKSFFWCDAQASSDAKPRGLSGAHDIRMGCAFEEC